MVAERELADNLLHIAPDFDLPRTLQTRSVVIYGTRGAGKTSGGVVFSEEFWEAVLQFVVIDPTGVWWGLRASRSGKSKGIPITVMGGLHGNLPLEPLAGEFVADLIVDNRMSVVLDLSMFEVEADKLRFVTTLLKRLFKRKMQMARKTGLHIIIDEADEFAPQPGPGTSLDNEQKYCIAAVKRVVLRGRAHGFGGTLIAQRNQHLNKSVAEMCDLLISFRSAGTRAIKAVVEWFESNEGKELVATVTPLLPKLEDGEAIVSSPQWLKVFKKVKFRMRRTFDAGATPDVNEAEGISEPKVLAEPDIAAIKEKMTAAIERAKADDPVELRKRIRLLEEEKRKLVATPAKAEPIEKIKVKVVERTVLGKRERVLVANVLEKLRNQIQTVEGSVNHLGGIRVDLQLALDQFSSVVSAAKASDEAVVAAVSASAHRQAVGAGVISSGVPSETPAPAGRIRAANNGEADGRRLSGARGARESSEAAPAGDGKAIGGGERNVLFTIGSYPDGVERDQLSVLTGYKKSSRDTYIARLRGGGYVETVDGKIRLTDAGYAALGPDFTPIPRDGSALRKYWEEKLPTGGELEIFKLAVGAYPQSITTEVLGEKLPYAKSSRDTYLVRLIARRVVRRIGRGEIKAADELFAA